GSGGRQRRRGGGKKVRQLLDGAGEIVQPTVGIACCECWRRMASEFLKCSQFDAGSPTQRQIRMAQRMKIGVERTIGAFHDVGDAGRNKVAPEHFSASAISCPRSTPNRL